MNPRLRPLLIAAALLFCLPAAATIIRPVQVEELARSSEVIVRGRAGPTRSAFTADGKQIRSVTTVQVAEALKGTPGAVVEVRTPGGSVGDLSQKVHGAPSFRDGEEVVLFLRRAGSQRFVVDGFSLGKFEIVREADGVRRVRQDVRGLGVLGADGQVRPAPRFEPVVEQAFLERVRRALLAGTVAP